jgi:hypothetical protein
VLDQIKVRLFQSKNPPEISRDDIKSVEPDSGSHLALMSAKTEAGSIWACRSMLADMPSSIRDPGIKRLPVQAADCQQCALSMRDASREFDR